MARFGSVGVHIGDDQLSKLVTYCDGFPDYVQRLGLELYPKMGGRPQQQENSNQKSSAGAAAYSSITSKQVDEAYENMILGLDGEFENYFATLSPLERGILIALSEGKSQTNEIAREARRPIFNISKTLATLINYGIIEKPFTGRYKISDPVFAD